MASKLRQRGTAFLLVYVPSKAQVTLPHLATDAPLLARTANHGASPLAEWLRSALTEGAASADTQE